MTIAEELAWDTAFFRRRIGRIRIDASTRAADVDGIASEMVRSPFECLYVEIDAAALAAATSLLKHASFCDIRVELGSELRPVRAPDHPATRLERWTEQEMSEVEALARDLARWSRFSLDPRFAGRAPDLYQRWAELAFSGAHGALIVRRGKQIAGVLTHSVDHSEARIELLSVAAAERGRGIGRRLIDTFLWVAKTSGADHAAVRTQSRNIQALRAYEGAGFRTRSCTVVIHCWRSRDSTEPTLMSDPLTSRAQSRVSSPQSRVRRPGT